MRIGRIGSSALVALLAWAGAASASASTLNVTGYTLGEQVRIASGGATGLINTAEFKVELDGQKGYSYCVDLAQTIGLGATTGWDVSSPEASAAIVRAAWLVDRFHGDVASNGAAGIAGLQLAIWETLADGPNANLFAGAFALQAGGASAGALQLASSYLGQLANADLSSFTTGAVWAVNTRRQDQLFFTAPIPEPSSIVLFGFGAAIVAEALRRKRA